MQKKYYILLAVVIIIGIIVYVIVSKTTDPQKADEMEAVTCSGKPIYRYKNPSEMFPVIMRDYTTNFKITSGVLDHLAGDSSGDVSVGVDVRNSARALRDTLNQDNIFFETALRAYFFASNNDPCNDSLRYMYTAFIKDMAGKVIEMKTFIAEVTVKPAATGTETPAKKDSILAVIDTATVKIDTTTKSANAGKLILLKDTRKINNAFKNINTNYTLSRDKKLIRTP